MNTFKLHGPLRAETKTNGYSNKFLKHKLLDLYPLLTEKHKTLNSTIGLTVCLQVDECSDEKIQIGLPDLYTSAAYHIHNTEEELIAPKENIFLTSISTTLALVHGSITQRIPSYTTFVKSRTTLQTSDVTKRS
jgi:hypothetical protein